MPLSFPVLALNYSITYSWKAFFQHSPVEISESLGQMLLFYETFSESLYQMKYCLCLNPFSIYWPEFSWGLFQNCFCMLLIYTFMYSWKMSRDFLQLNRKEAKNKDKTFNFQVLKYSFIQPTFPILKLEPQ